MITSLNDHAPTPFQVLRQPMDAPDAIFLTGGTPFISAPPRGNFVEEITLCHLDTPLKMEKVQSLRGHINLPSGCRDARFFEQEKKETNWALCLHLSSNAW
ncbi:hypothetical protein [Polaromonas sp. P5_D5]